MVRHIRRSVLTPLEEGLGVLLLVMDVPEDRILRVFGYITNCVLEHSSKSRPSHQRQEVIHISTYRVSPPEHSSPLAHTLALLPPSSS